MSCLLTQGFTVGCKDSTGGIVAFYIGNFDATTLSVTANASGTVTAITGATVYKYECVKQTSSTTEAIQVSVENGSVVYEQTAVYSLLKAEQTKRNEIKLLAQALLIVIAQDSNGKYWLYGRTNGADLSEGSALSGTAYTDKNGYDLTFVGREPEPAPEVLFSAFSGIIG